MHVPVKYLFLIHLHCISTFIFPIELYASNPCIHFVSHLEVYIREVSTFPTKTKKTIFKVIFSICTYSSFIFHLYNNWGINTYFVLTIASSYHGLRSEKRRGRRNLFHTKLVTGYLLVGQPRLLVGNAIVVSIVWQTVASSSVRVAFINQSFGHRVFTSLDSAKASVWLRACLKQTHFRLSFVEIS